MDTYREQLINSINELWEARVKVFGCIVSLAMTNHLKEINDAFEIGDVFEFQYAHFEDIDDSNIQSMIALCKEMDDTISRLMNINGIGKDEVNLD
ncbi:MULTISPECIES: hypothetical protein [Mongoliitalea]|uniref:Uncharacterized protein n=1 Tax=Mongoliitalea lutea TaxID=849756 RepID=A0A8J3D154_9BACT|nr:MULTISPECIES: hypothetical protein [Mongoliitalea]UJP65138.1 hypothetical protein IPZ59_00405 [Mongoliitalea daihaiensis]GHB52815.1 hypothetical protein GCM10008106_36750 [Mongoliitalea lutea]